MKKLLVIRFSALGDIAMTVPVIYDLAVQYPDIEITILSREMARPLFERLPENVHFYAADLNGRHKGLLGLCRLWRDASLSDFDYIADFHNVLRTWWLRAEGCLRRKKVAKINKGRKGKKALTRRTTKFSSSKPPRLNATPKYSSNWGSPQSLNSSNSTILTSASGQNHKAQPGSA